MPIIAFLAPRRPSRRTLRAALVGAVRSVVAPATLFRAPSVVQRTTQVVTETVTTEPADLFAEADMPPVEDIEAAAAQYFRAADAARAADRTKRKTRKILDRLSAGRYGDWLIEREPSGRSTVDLEAVRATYKRLGLGEVPMRSAAPSLKVKRVQLDTAPELVGAEFSALAGAR